MRPELLKPDFSGALAPRPRDCQCAQLLDVRLRRPLSQCLRQTMYGVLPAL